MEEKGNQIYILEYQNGRNERNRRTKRVNAVKKILTKKKQTRTS